MINHAEAEANLHALEETAVRNVRGTSYLGYLTVIHVEGNRFRYERGYQNPITRDLAISYLSHWLIQNENSPTSFNEGC